MELVATEAGPVFRYWSCTVPIGVTPDGHLHLEREPDWSGCAGDPAVGSHIGPIDEVLVDASGRERTPRSARAWSAAEFSVG